MKTNAEAVPVGGEAEAWPQWSHQNTDDNCHHCPHLQFQGWCVHVPRCGRVYILGILNEHTSLIENAYVMCQIVPPPIYTLSSKP